MEYREVGGKMRRVHREYVDVVARIGRDGSVDPVAVLWRDGRSFFVDEVLGSRAGPELRGVQTTRYRVRVGPRETELYLERRGPSPDGAPAPLRWWVFALDRRPRPPAGGARA